MGTYSVNRVATEAEATALVAQLLDAAGERSDVGLAAMRHLQRAIKTARLFPGDGWFNDVAIETEEALIRGGWVSPINAT